MAAENYFSTVHELKYHLPDREVNLRGYRGEAKSADKDKAQQDLLNPCFILPLRPRRLCGSIHLLPRRNFLTEHIGGIS